MRQEWHQNHSESRNQNLPVNPPRVPCPENPPTSHHRPQRTEYSNGRHMVRQTPAPPQPFQCNIVLFVLIPILDFISASFMFSLLNMLAHFTQLTLLKAPVPPRHARRCFRCIAVEDADLPISFGNSRMKSPFRNPPSVFVTFKSVIPAPSRNPTRGAQHQENGETPRRAR
jgi:hypothetical protein